MNLPHIKNTDKNVTYAYEPDTKLRELMGKSTILSDIFTKEKIAACQKLIDDAKDTFFETAQVDIDTIAALASDEAYKNDYPELCRKLFQPVTNVKGQAELFGFQLIARVCKYLLEYCESSSTTKCMNAKDTFIIAKLVEALRRAFQARIVDAGGAIERELVSVVELARK